MELKTLKIEELRGYIRAEREKGRSMREIVKELADNRDDVTILSHDPKISERQVIEALTKTRQFSQMLERLVEPSERSFYETGTPSEWVRAFQEWVESHRKLNLPLLSNEAISRESIYGERG